MSWGEGGITIDVPPQFVFNLSFLCFLFDCHFFHFTAIYICFGQFSGVFVHSLFSAVGVLTRFIIHNGQRSVWATLENVSQCIYLIICHFLTSFL